jgi:hypothetical protein
MNGIWGFTGPKNHKRIFKLIKVKERKCRAVFIVEDGDYRSTAWRGWPLRTEL